MTNKQETISLISTLIGKPIIVIYNDEEEGTAYTYVIDESIMANPSNYIFENYIMGREITKVIDGMIGFAAAPHISNDFASIHTQIEAIKPIKFRFPSTFKWVKFTF